MSLCCCARCGKQVFKDDRRIAVGKVWHSFCFSCYFCKQLLDECNFQQRNGELFCKCCCKLLFNCGSSLEVARHKACPPCQPCTAVSLMPKAGCKTPNVHCLKSVCSKKCYCNACVSSKPCTPCKPCSPCDVKPYSPCKPTRTCDPCRISCSKPYEPCCDQCCSVCKPCDCYNIRDPCDMCCSTPYCTPKKCAENTINCCTRSPPPCPTPVPRETACFYNRSHRRSVCVPCGTQREPCCFSRNSPCRSPCTIEPDPCLPCEICPPTCPPACGPSHCPDSDPCCESCSPRCIYYPPIKRCEPIPSEIICLESCPIEPPQKCCYTPTNLPFCNTCKSCKGVACCRRCGQKVYTFEKIGASGGVYHTCCFTCYCCGLQLDVSNRYESCGEIYCKGCYRKLFGVGGYGY